ncbi:MAG TPA: aldose 1-epimerase family protein [Gemmataceae bacterium]|nr:aldose 1-epimerase family protein [Gemmataceae bacterium]
MTRFKSWTLTDVRGDVWQDAFSAGADALRLPTPFDWSIRKRTLRGGLRDGVDLIEVHNGALSFSVLPTRGMGIWRGDYHGLPLGWRSPVQGPVHPKFVHPSDRGGLGWLAGFDELLCRCGLASNGPPGQDGEGGLAQHTLHGRIANQPADVVEVSVALDPPHELTVRGEVEEAALFCPHLRLTATYVTAPGSNRVVIHDIVENQSAQPAAMQILYHCNFGPPLLEAGGRVLAPVREVAPQTPRAAEGIASYETCAGPVAGFAEQVYLYDLLADSRGQTLAVLVNAAQDRAVAIRFNRKDLPCFTVWKNTGALEDGYVTGLEPATNYPNFRGFERNQGRVPMLPPGGRWESRWSLEVADTAAAVSALLAEVATLQAHARAVVHRQPHPRFSPT